MTSLLSRARFALALAVATVAGPLVAPASALQLTPARQVQPKTPRKQAARPGARRTRRSSPVRLSTAARTRAAAAAPASFRYSAPRSASGLQSDLESMLTARTRGGKWGVMIVSLTRGDTLFRFNADEPMLPASTMKMYTTAVALDRFGPTYQLSTDVLRDGSLGTDGTVNGNLYLRGDGDPALSNRFVKGDANAPMDALAERVVAAGVKHVRGDLVGDATGFDGQLIPDGWRSRYLGAGYAARVSALSLNENLVWVAVFPGVSGGPARVALEPATTAIGIAGGVRTVAGNGGRVVAHMTRDGQIAVSGTIGARSVPRRYSLIVDDPAPFTTGALRAALAGRGVTVDGQIRIARTPATAVKVASLHYAELLFRDAARGTGRTQVGSAATGSAALYRFLTEKAGVKPGEVEAHDGSGLSTLDRVTPRSMVHLLGYANEAPWADAFHASLPVAGVSELLRNRFKGTPAQGNLHAKTGTTNEVIGLGGYVTAHDGEVLAFSFLYNGADRWNAKSTIDQMGATLAGFGRE
jgi:serine-type D-Ala-D-Ala carboxypeptidase/endopeptidase (penicillin-binding protein 4)